MARYSITGLPDRKRKDTAADAIRHAIYDEIKSWAGLDTQWGWNAYRAGQRVAHEIAQGVPVGYSATIEIGHQYATPITIERVD
mgnify:CR=1 FL=1